MQQLEGPAARPWARRAVAAGAAAIAFVVVALLVVNGRTEARLMRADPDAVVADRGLMRFATSRGSGVFKARCASCHGADGRGVRRFGSANLTDADYLYGSGQASEIEKIVTYGIRSHNSKGWDLAIMPAFATANPSPSYKIPPLAPGDIRDITEFVQYLGGKNADPEAAARGSKLFADRGGCYDCHAPDGAGDSAIGAPNLTDNIWLYGDGSRKSVSNSIAYGHRGRCPAWIGRLPSRQIREVALYVYSLSHSRPTAPAKAS